MSAAHLSFRKVCDEASPPHRWSTDPVTASERDRLSKPALATPAPTGKKGVDTLAVVSSGDGLSSSSPAAIPGWEVREIESPSCLPARPPPSPTTEPWR